MQLLNIFISSMKREMWVYNYLAVIFRYRQIITNPLKHVGQAQKDDRVITINQKVYNGMFVVPLAEYHVRSF